MSTRARYQPWFRFEPINREVCEQVFDIGGGYAQLVCRDGQWTISLNGAAWSGENFFRSQRTVGP